jgi:protein pelota
MAQMTETKVAREVEILNKFMRMMENCPDKAYYGYDHVAKAHEELAIDSLLVTDELFRNTNVKKRKQYVKLVESVRENGGTVFIFSSMHVSGQQLQQVSGVAAILRYPLPDLDELEEAALAHHADDEGRADEGGGDVEEEEYDPNRRVREDLEDMGFR